MQNVIATGFIVFPAALVFGLLAVPLNAQLLYWFVVVPLAVLAVAGVI